MAVVAGWEGRFFEDFCNWGDNAAYRRFIFETPLAQLAQRLMGSSTVRLYHDHLLVKEPGTRQRTPWHQDQPYYELKGRWCNSWIPLDPVDAVDSLRFVKGSHAWNRLFTPKSFTEGYGRFEIQDGQSPIEPVPADSPLLADPRVILTPHAAFYSVESEIELRRKAAMNIVQWMQCGRPTYPVVIGRRAPPANAAR